MKVVYILASIFSVLVAIGGLVLASGPVLHPNVFAGRAPHTYVLFALLTLFMVIAGIKGAVANWTAARKTS